MTYANTFTEYGIRQATGEIVWPDEDGDLYDYEEERYVRATDYRDEFSVSRIEAIHIRPGGRLVRRTWTAGPVLPAVEVPLPTTPGSVVRATLYDERVTAILSEDADGIPWHVYSSDQDWAREDELADVEVLYDAGAEG